MPIGKTEKPPIGIFICQTRMSKMPYKLKGNCVVRADTGETVKCHDNHSDAVAHLRALEANVDKSMKIGARNSSADAKRIQSMHDMSVELGAMCGEPDNDESKSLSTAKMMKLYEIGGLDYARQEGWDIQSACSAMSQVAALVYSEVDEPDISKLATIMRGLLEFLRGEIDEMEQSALQGQRESKSFSQPKEHNDSKLDLSYFKSLHVDIPINKLAVKYVGKNTIAHPVFIWGNEKKTDLDVEFFKSDSDFWDTALKDLQRPLTWDHGQDELFNEFEPNPVIGKTVKFYDDAIARWAESVIETDKKYRKFIDQFIEEKRLGYSSDSLAQYIIREKQGKAIWLKAWPWFGGSLTASPCEPRMKVFTPEFVKSLGIQLPDVNESHSRYEVLKRQSELLKLKER